MPQHARMEELFHAALAAEPGERDPLLQRECGGDHELLRLVRELLEEDASDTRSVLALWGEPEEDAQARPARVGPYEVLGLLGEGGMGSVYRARQENPRREVALKVISPAAMTREGRRRFARESRSLAHLKHPGITQIFEAGTAPDDRGVVRPFIAMELVSGSAILQHADAACLGLQARLELIARVADAVQHAHQRGVIHRDLKPQNIVVEPLAGDAVGQPKVLDFGIARATDAPGLTRSVVTDSHQIVGTLAYMSPEQLAGEAAQVDTRADVYALGVLLFELLAGRPPHDLAGHTLAECARIIRDVEPPRLGSLRRDCRGDIETIARHATEKDRERRYATAAELAADLRCVVAHRPISARRPTAIYQLTRFVRRNRSLTAAACVALAAIVAGSGASVVGYVRAIESQRRADAQRAIAEEETRRLRRAVSFLHDGLVSTSYAFNIGPAVSLADAFRAAGTNAAAYFKDDPLSEARVRQTIAYLFTSRGDFAEAIPYARDAARLLEPFRTAGAGKDTQADAQGIERALIASLAQVGDAQDAVDRARAFAASLDGMTLTPTARQHARCMLATALQERGRVTEALTLLDDIVARVRVAAPGDAVMWQYPVSRQGWALTACGRGSEYDAMTSEILSANASGSAHARVRVSYLNQSADMYQAAGLEQDRERLLRRAVETVSHDCNEPFLPASQLVVLAECLLDRPPPSRTDAIEIAQRARDTFRSATFDDPRDGAMWTHRAEAALLRAVARSGDLARTKSLLASLPTAEPDEARYAPDALRLARAEALLALGEAAEADALAQAELEHRLGVRFLWDPLTHDALRTAALARVAAQGAEAGIALLTAHAEDALKASNATTPGYVATSCFIADALVSLGGVSRADEILMRHDELLRARTPHPRPCSLRLLRTQLRVRELRAGRGASDELRAQWLQRVEATLGPGHPWSAAIAGDR